MNAGRLLHLAKYLTRAAGNAQGRPMSEALANLLEKDLYEWIEGGRPAAVFEREATLLPRPQAHAVELAFEALDRLEPKVRAHEALALRAACEIALRIALIIRTQLDASLAELRA